MKRRIVDVIAVLLTAPMLGCGQGESVEPTGKGIPVKEAEEIFRQAGDVSDDSTDKSRDSK